MTKRLLVNIFILDLRKIAPARRLAEDSAIARQGKSNNAGAVLRLSNI
jgi:hypothetical protein